MRIFRTVLIFALSVAIAILSPRPVGIPFLALTGTFDKPLLKLRGSVKMPDGTVLTVRLSRLQEQFRLGRLESAWLDAGGGPVEVRKGRFSYEEPVFRPGVYRAVVEGGGARARPVDVYGWDDAFLPRVLEERKAIESLLLQAEKVYDWMRPAAETEHEWSRAAFEVLSNAGRLQNRAAWLDGPGARLPAAEHELSVALRMMTSVPPHFFWSSEGFGGAFDTASETWVKGPDGSPFTFAGMAAHLDSVRDLVRRESALWILQEGRRVYRDDPVLAAARIRHPEIREIVEGAERSLDRLEDRLRGTTAEKPVVSPPPTPPQFIAAAARLRKLREARRILEEADRLWDQIGDRRSPSLYRKLRSDYRDVLDELHARVRVGNRARAESE